jgi:uncharacterized SAM-binding protein YcdF (DUF218 family)
MEFGQFKPVLAALVLPPAGPVLLALFGVLLSFRWRRAGLAMAVAALVGLWLLSCNAVALRLAHRMLPQVETITATELQAVQAIVVLGAGVVPSASEQGSDQPSALTAGRIRYAAGLARRGGKPLGFSGGSSWSAGARPGPSEAAVARRAALQQGMALRWVDDQARDTAQNADRMAQLMQRDGIKRIALVTDPWHMPRATHAFTMSRFEVTPAPTTGPVPLERSLLEWLPSSHGLTTSRQVIREWLALWLTLA